jgi:hypothetical protein
MQRKTGCGQFEKWLHESGAVASCVIKNKRDRTYSYNIAHINESSENV